MLFKNKLLSKTTLLAVLLVVSNAAQSESPSQALKIDSKIATSAKKATSKAASSTMVSSKQTITRLQFTPIRTLQKAQLVRLQPIKPSEKKPQGPDPERYISLRDLLDETLLLKDVEQIAGWDGDMLFQDKAVGNVFYYVPRVFLLKHDENGYAFGVQYNKQVDQDKPSVTLSMELSAQGFPGDTALLKQILHEALELKSSEKVKLKSLSGSGITVDFDSLSTGLAIDKERVHITPPKNLHDNLHITFSLTQDETESVFSLIAHEGMVGSLILPISGDKANSDSKGEKSEVSIPFKIKYSKFSGDPVYGFEKWWLDKQQIGKVTNTSLYPLTLNAINGYIVKNGKLERVTKPFKKSVLLKPGASKKIKLSSAKKVLGSEILVAWLDSSLDTSCEDCIRKIKAQIDRGVSDNPTTDITFEAIPSVFEDMGLYKIIIRVKSPYYSIDRKKVEERTVQLTEEDNSSSVPIYYPEKKKNPLLFRYQIKMITNSGEEMNHENWIDGRELTKIIGSSQLESIMEQEEVEN